MVEDERKGGVKSMSRAALKVESALAQGDIKLVKKLVESLPVEDHVYLLKDLYSKQMTADGFQKMDTDRDGFVTEKEFDEFIKELNLNKKVPPSIRQLTFVAIASGVPFIGFGFMDNSIMIVAGEAIEVNIASLGCTTMCAAALGNLVSDVFGVGLAGYIELLAKRMGIRDPLLTPYQMKLGVVRWASSLGAAIGVSIGCVLGMFPLLFFADNEEEEKAKKPESELYEDEKPAKA
mmetsp:Transcript_28305/g.70054  ORF Transcript_28305/g.70054 Transcript_28305/m.70054 type:complete len:235 (+) Transcript_28305:32-736(+)